MRLLLALLLFAAQGTYTGKWSSDQNENGGAITIQLTLEPHVSFTFNGENVTTKVSSFKAEGEKLSLEYDYAVGGYNLRSYVTATITDGKLAGKYRAKSIDGGAEVDSGTITASQKRD